MTVFFTSDHHFGHANIIQYESRDFMDVNTMNNHLIYMWNQVVTADDIVYHLGDFALMKKDLIKPIFDQLNGEIHLILGNHDHSKKFYEEMGFKTVRNHAVIDEYDLSILMVHDPLKINDIANRWDPPKLILHGHVHGKKKRWSPGGNIVHVGVDAWEYRPVELDRLLSVIEDKNEID